MGADGNPKVAPNVVNHDFMRGEPLKVISTDITYLLNADGFSYVSGIIDCETRELIAHFISDSMEEQFVLDTYDQLSGLDLLGDIWSCSDQDVHCTARAFRDKLAELGIGQSMSGRAGCKDNAPIEGFWGRMKAQMDPTAQMTHGEIVGLVDDYVDCCNHERGQPGWAGSPRRSTRSRLSPEVVRNQGSTSTTYTIWPRA